MRIYGKQLLRKKRRWIIILGDQFFTDLVNLRWLGDELESVILAEPHAVEFVDVLDGVATVAIAATLKIKRF